MGFSCICLSYKRKHNEKAWNDWKEEILKTLNGEQEIELKVVAGLEIANSGVEDKYKLLNVPVSYTRKELPTDIDEATIREKIKCWDHLKQIFGEVPQENNINFEFLIRVNCTEVLEPQEVIPRKIGGSLAFHSQQ